MLTRPPPSNARRAGLALAVAAVSLAASGCQVAATGQNLAGARLVEQGQYAAALQHFQDAAANDPANADAYYNLAATYHRMGAQRGDAQLLAQAESLYNQSLDRNENHADCRRGLAVLLVETGRADKAFTMLKNWAARSPNLADPRIELARMHQEFGERDTAKVHLDYALQLDPQNARAWRAQGALREAEGDYAQALANYQRSFALNNFQPQVAAKIATLQQQAPGGLAPSVPGGRWVTGPTGTPRY